ncbi:unnamed protein product, partial [Ectocarpus sp. 4 AP-2014]
HACSPIETRCAFSTYCCTVPLSLYQANSGRPHPDFAILADLVLGISPCSNVHAPLARSCHTTTRIAKTKTLNLPLGFPHFLPWHLLKITFVLFASPLFTRPLACLSFRNHNNNHIAASLVSRALNNKKS